MHLFDVYFTFKSGPKVIKLFILNSVEHDICSAYITQIANNCKFFYLVDRVWHCVHPVGKKGTGCFAFLCFVAFFFFAVYCQLWFVCSSSMASLVGYVLGPVVQN